MITIFSISSSGWWPLWLQTKKSPEKKKTGTLWWFCNFQTYGAEVIEFWVPNICHWKFYQKLKVKVERRWIRDIEIVSFQYDSPRLPPKRPEERQMLSFLTDKSPKRVGRQCQQWDSNPRPFGPVPETGALDQLGHIDLLPNLVKV